MSSGKCWRTWTKCASNSRSRPTPIRRPETQRQLEQTRNDMERAAQQMQQQSASQALAAGTRAQETMQNLRNDLQRQSSSQFAEQMRQMRGQARDLTQRENEIARGLDSLNNGEHHALDNSADRQQIVQQMARQQSALTNLLAQMRAVSEQSEATEPLLSQQLYDTLRRADQMHTDNLLDVGSQLTERGFLPQASQAESMARTNLTEIARGIDRAADSVLGSETDALRYAQRQLDDLTRQVERELPGAGTNAAALAASTNNGALYQSNLLARAARKHHPRRRHEWNRRSQWPFGSGRTAVAGKQFEWPAAGKFREHGTKWKPGSTSRRQQRRTGFGGQPAGGSTSGTGTSRRSKNNPGGGNRGGDQQQANNARGGNGQRGTQARAGGNNGGDQDRLRQLAVELGGNNAVGGPITGGGYLYWSDQLRNVEQAVDQQDLRNQLATVRERVSAMRAEFRQTQRKPDVNVVREQIITPLTQVRSWLQDELARRENSDSLAPLDRDPVPDHYTELVRQYYEKLGSAQ